MALPRLGNPLPRALNLLAEAEAQHDQLKSDLPRYYSLLTEAEREADQLKKQGASLEAQAFARTQVTTAGVMLSEYQAEITAAKESVDKHQEQAEQAKADEVLEHLQSPGIDYTAVLTRESFDRRSSEQDLLHAKEVSWPKPYGKLLFTAVENRLNNPHRNVKPE